MMKKWIAAVLAALMMLSCAAVAEAGMANPWTESTAEEVLEVFGVELGVPDGATDVTWRMNEASQMAEMDFIWDGMAYTARVAPANEFEDISGLYYEWTLEDACSVGRCDGVCRRAFDEGLTVDVCLWYDDLTGLMYCVCAAAEDLDGFDIQAAADQVYIPMQTE